MENTEELYDTIKYLLSVFGKAKVHVHALHELNSLSSEISNHILKCMRKESLYDTDIVDLMDKMANVKIALSALLQYYDIPDSDIDKICTLKLFDAKQLAKAEEERQKERQEQLIRVAQELKKEKYEK